MASDDTMTIHSSMHEDEDDDEHHHGHNLSRLSICSSKHSMIDFEEGTGGCSGGDMMMMYMSGLSVESSYGEGEEADEELSEDDKRRGVNMYGGFSDSDKGLIGGSCLSLPGTPLQQIHQGGTVDDNNTSKDYYCSENEGRAGNKGIMRSKKKRNSRRRAVRERWLDIEWEKKKYIAAKVMDAESDHASVLRTGSLCIDLEEVKACRDLGFEPEIPSQFSCSTIDTASSGGNSPIANWRISSPGDDPKDVKARLKVWAQAVATSASRLVG